MGAADRFCTAGAPSAPLLPLSGAVFGPAPPVVPRPFGRLPELPAAAGRSIFDGGTVMLAQLETQGLLKS